jgi:dihydroflavonol-4-reductase
MSAAGRLNILVVGGTGFLGYHASLELLRRGHAVTALALDLPQPDLLPDAVRFVKADLNAMPDGEVTALLAGRDAVVFAAGADDRVMPKAPAYAFFHQHNVASVERLFRLAREAGVRRGVVCGSYFAYFDRTRPELRLAETHPYIRSRRDQARVAMEVGGEALSVCILELPYIFGTIPGRRPLWHPLVRYLASPWPILYTRGGTNMVAVGRVAEAIAGAVERPEVRGPQVVGDENRTWPELLVPMAAMAGRRKRVYALPTFVVWLVLLLVGFWHRLRGIESGLNPSAFVMLQTANTFFDPKESRDALGYGTGGLDEALRETVAACIDSPSR